MKHLRAINQKAIRMDGDMPPAVTAGKEGETREAEDIVALQNAGAAKPHVPMGCSIVFSPGWEVDSAGGTAGLCQPVERDIYDCYVTCYWPAQVPDHLNNYPDWNSKCAVATKDWRNIDIVFP